MKRVRTRPFDGHRLTRLSALLTSSAFATMLAPQAHGQTAAAAPGAAASAAIGNPTGNAPGDAVGLERVVVTATSQAKSKMRSSVSVTDIDQEQVRDYGARTEAEVLLLIPGIRTDATAGPGGNANISVRGLPIASGGSKYVQLQEDGLPTVQFGDMNFANNDYWIRFDNNVDHIQTLRGGSSSVFASQAPGAVLNYISKTGKEPGGSIGLTRGLNYRETRLDGDYGNQIAPDLYYHVGGYYRLGEGNRHTTADSLRGLQLKGNITKEFNGEKSYVRLNFKVLHEHAPTTPQTFMNATVLGDRAGGFTKTSGYDALRDSQYSQFNSSVLSVDPATRGISTSSLVDGITARTRSVGFELHNEFAGGFTVDDKFRYSKNSGAFQAQFWNTQTLAYMLANFGSGATNAKYYNGPHAGQAVTAGNLATGLVSQGAAINVQTPDMGILTNDASLNKTFKIDNVGTLDTRVGYFHSRQNVKQRWAISERVVAAERDGGIIDVYDGAGNALTSAGLTGYNNQWGACCARDINTHFTTDAPYLSLNLASGPVDVDAGVRREWFRADGTYAGSLLVPGGLDVNGDGRITGAEKNVYVANTAAPGLVNYKIAYNNYSLGVNYRFTPDLSGFVRASKGNRAIADRLLYSANIDPATGNLTAGGATAAVAPVKQYELGLKNKGTYSLGTYGVAATVFRSTTNEYDYDQTRQDNPNLPGYQGPKLNQKGYRATGIELETAGSIGNFAVNVNVVYSDEVVTANLGDPTNVGKTSGGVPRWRYTISPRYAIGPVVFGATMRGQGWVYADDNNTQRINGHYIVNGFVNYEFGGGFVASLNANNLLNKLYPAGGGGFVPGSTTVYGAGVEGGRTVSASLRYIY